FAWLRVSELVDRYVVDDMLCDLGVETCVRRFEDYLPGNCEWVCPFSDRRPFRKVERILEVAGSGGLFSGNYRRVHSEVGFACSENSKTKFLFAEFGLTLLELCRRASQP